MNPLGIALAFTLFWAAIGLGIFLASTGSIGLASTRQSYGFTAQHSISQLVGALGNGLMLVLGLALIAAGAYANYVVLYR